MFVSLATERNQRSAR